ncbi:flagellar hook-basal body complex protein FliE [Salirhabdus sp. Marseille-P4669]|uniref:flagellar hook-basal body complex protein FliE n=1 Tax=Salirhabdus sp. Marseille-P4669 TaxID=2042310 RepID=UPI000C7E2339|nr:flagellar hook-basal body complex protein FliE [Salirhabdus sp. Marseille-P4669]
MTTINPVTLNAISETTNTNKISPFKAQQSFANSLKSALESVNEAQITSDQKTEALAKGEIDNLHDVMITSQKASIMLQTTVEIQTKVIDAYKEVMRMQI